MKLEELAALLDNQDELGLDSIVLKKPYPKAGIANSGMVRTPFGLCRALSWTPNGMEVVFVVEKWRVKKFIVKAVKQNELLSEKMADWLKRSEELLRTNREKYIHGKWDAEASDE